MNDLFSPPESLKAAVYAFSQQLRTPLACTAERTSSFQIYRQIICDNIQQVLENVFPLFCARLNTEQRHQWVSTFIQQHSAEQPEFHQIATEWLLFLRQQSVLSTHMQPLIEYEWLLYSTEINEAVISPPQNIHLTHELIHHAAVTFNPTLNIVALPFSLTKYDESHQSQPHPHYYIIYRQYTHGLFQKALDTTDIRYFAELQNKKPLSDLLQEKIESSELSDWLQWLENNIQNEILSIKINE
ncbi:TPA: putative DNA-binding domain-containing protein [Providencia alcalifaciens]